jgi:transcriptional regulator with XRE-family HTH domain
MEHEIERLDKYLKSKGINDNQFTELTGISNGWIGKARENKPSLTDKTRTPIFKAFPDLSDVWLKTGIGSMIKGQTIEATSETDLAAKFQRLADFYKKRADHYEKLLIERGISLD